MKRLTIVLATALLVISCQDVPGPTDVLPEPLAQIMDAAHSGGRAGFYFGYPVGFPDSMGIFDPSFLPVLSVEICEWDGVECLLPLVERITSESSEFGAAPIRVKNDTSAFSTRWDTWDYGVEAGKTYRIRVLASDVALGHFDVILTEDRSAFKDVDRNENVALVENGRLPIIFRVEEGVLCDPAAEICEEVVVNAEEGGTLVVEETGEVVDIPPQDGGFVVEDGEGGTITVETITLVAEACEAPGELPIDLPQFGNCLDVRTEPPLADSLESPATVAVCSFDFGSIPPLYNHEQEHLVTLHRWDEDEDVVEALPHAEYLCDDGNGFAPSPGFLMRFAQGGLQRLLKLVTPSPLYAKAPVVMHRGPAGITPMFSKFRMALPAKMAVLHGDGQSAEVGTAVATAPAVLVTDLLGNPVADAVVRFEVEAGSGTVDPGTTDSIEVLSDVAGIADVSAWTLGPVAGANVLRASGRGIADAGNDGPRPGFDPFAPWDSEFDFPLPSGADTIAQQTLQVGYIEFTATGVAGGATGEWTLTGDMSVGRRAHTATLLPGGAVLIVGFPTQDAELYDPATGIFTATGNPVFNHYQGPTATLLADGTVLVVGGDQAPTSAEIYDPATGIFTATNGNPVGYRRYHSATLLDDGRVLIVGGRDSAGWSQTSAELYDPASGTFSTTGSLVGDRNIHAAVKLADGRVLVMGGSETTTPGYGVCLRSAELFDPVSETFSVTADMLQAICSPLPELLISDNVLVIGRYTTTELYDPTTESFTATGEMATPHASGTVTRLADGRILVAGGYIATGPVTTDGAELYDPLTGLFSPAASMNVARQQHTGTLLLDGRVLVTGGTSPASGYLASAEYYTPQATLTVPQTWLVDLETASLVGAASPEVDIWFEAVTATERYLTRRNSATMAVFGTTRPGEAGCLGLTLSADRIPMGDLPTGTFVCVRSTEGNLAEVEIIEAATPSPGQMTIGIWVFP